jgi:small subunit ribosomal protein S4
MNARGPKVRISRRLGIALTPKANKVMQRRSNPPGQHGNAQGKQDKGTDYKRHLIEKQRLRAQYHINEQQMTEYVRKAIQQKGNPVDNLIRMLESRLDAVVYRAGLARTIYATKQLIAHGHFLINGKKADFSSQRVRVRDVVSVRPASRQLQPFIEAAEEMVAKPTLTYLERSKEEMSARLLYLPKAEEVPVLCEVPLVIEYYSR